MSIELTPAFMDRLLFLRMAKDYVETLAKYDKEIRWDEAAWKSVAWRAWLIVEDRTVQGFLITSEKHFDLFPAAFYIEEFYIVPEARNRGVGKAAVEEVLKNWHGDIYFYVLKSNIQALLFWTAIAEVLGWREIKRPEINEESGCKLMVYNKK